MGVTIRQHAAHDSNEVEIASKLGG